MLSRGVAEHPARRRRLGEAAAWRAVDQLVTTVLPSGGLTLGLAMVWPQPALEERIRRRALALWRELLAGDGVEPDGCAPLASALRERALALRRGHRGAVLGTARLASLLDAAAAGLSPPDP